MGVVSFTKGGDTNYSLHKAAAGILLARLFVEHLRCHGQVARLFHQAVKLLAALQNAVNGVVQNHLRLVEFALDREQLVRLCRILVLFDSLLADGVAVCAVSANSRPRVAHFPHVVVEHLVYDAEGAARGILLVAEDDRNDAVFVIYVSHVLLVRDGLAHAVRRSFADGPAYEHEHFLDSSPLEESET